MQIPVYLKHPVAMVFVGLWCLCCARIALAERVVNFDILLDGKVVLTSSTGDKGGVQDSPDVVWRYLNQLEFRPAQGFTLPVQADNSLRATLNGKIRIFARYGGDAKVTELILVRNKEADGKWKLEPKEIERTFKIRKIDP